MLQAALPDLPAPNGLGLAGNPLPGAQTAVAVAAAGLPDTLLLEPAGTMPPASRLVPAACHRGIWLLAT